MLVFKILLFWLIKLGFELLFIITTIFGIHYMYLKFLKNEK